ncbi:DEKNAAC103126 [Brettanomyces naardenensis]|uniref:DEKNAAC103126 n=1 Tax=Brettanomyces naardenensis TaxID=13370 RepID=A0A448YMD6_BRENA|nr:DEKNAAC103126 [Brettanomyces naardenensis]
MAVRSDLHYDYNTLPTFGKRRVRNLINDYQVHSQKPRITSGSLLMHSSNDDSQQGQAAPFVPEEQLLPDSLLESAIADANRRVVSGGGNNFNSFPKHKPTLFSQRIDGLFKSFSRSVDGSEIEIKNKLAGKPSSSPSDESDFLGFLRLLWIAVSGLGHKLFAWTLYILTIITSYLVSLVNKIPNPAEANEEVSDVGIPDGAFQSTPMTEDRHSVKTDERRGSLRRIADIIRAEDEVKEDKHLEVPEDTEEILQGKRQYGTFFFEPKTRARPSIRERLPLKNNMKPEPLGYHDQNSQLLSRASSIRSDLTKLFKVNDNESDSILQRPSFTRSSARFQDMEWFRDEDEDYLNNLESTNLFKEYQKIMEERMKMQQLLKLSKMKEEAKVRPLTNNQLSKLDRWWNNPYPGTVVITKFNIGITVKDLLTLCDRKWLNDNVIDFYMNLINERSKNSPSLPSIHVFSTYFYSTLCRNGYSGVRKWAKRANVDVTKVDHVFIPINIHQSHWALGVVNNKTKSFDYYDSLFGTGNDILYKLEDYMTEEAKKDHGESYVDYSKYDFNAAMKCPTQSNGFDCGVFTCTTADYLAREVPLLYSQADMPVLRRRMAYEIADGKLVDH